MMPGSPLPVLVSTVSPHSASGVMTSPSAAALDSGVGETPDAGRVREREAAAFGGASDNAKLLSADESATMAFSLDRIFTSMAGLNPSASSPASSSTSLHWTALSSLSASSAICDGNRASNKLACRAGRADASPSDSSSTGTAPLPSSVTCELPRASPCVGQLGPAKVRMQSTARSRERCESKTKGKSRSSSRSTISVGPCSSTTAVMAWS
mmetsp:Transcript_12302/g.40414  ORF Transcript_12302/g.40414 Transcript_12302/m.40414 type:complete len:211 (+) Transcript_12302:677-1309(+)